MGDPSGFLAPQGQGSLRPTLGPALMGCWMGRDAPPAGALSVEKDEASSAPRYSAFCGIASVGAAVGTSATLKMVER